MFQIMVLTLKHFKVYYCINDQTKLQIFREIGLQTILSETRNILSTFLCQGKH